LYVVQTWTLINRPSAVADSEFWEVRNKAMTAIKSLVAQVEKAPNVTDIISLQVFRLLKDPIKNMISDLRSQQVRDTCGLLVLFTDTQLALHQLLKDTCFFGV
jgi:hypothetical protein